MEMNGKTENKCSRSLEKFISVLQSIYYGWSNIARPVVKIYGSINNPALSLLMKHLVIGQHQKASNFSAFYWSPHSSLVSIGQHFVTTRVVHLPKRTETSLITESDQSGPNHHLLQLCTAHTAWSDFRTRLSGPCIAAIAVFVDF